MRWFHSPIVQVTLVLVGLLGYHLCLTHGGEPFFNNDESRHTMSSVFFADVYHDFGQFLSNPKDYTVRYYCQYPGIGIITWPPLFYAIVGVAMSFFGPHFWVARCCVALLSAWSCVSVYRLVRLNYSHKLSLMSMVLVALSPLVFVYSQRVMLELPCFSFVVAALFRYEHFLKIRDRRSALLAWAWAAAAMLTRFDGLFILPYFLIRLLHDRAWCVFARWPVWLGAMAGLGVVVPYYLFTLVVYKQGLSHSTQSDVGQLSLFARLWYYPGTIFEQTGPMLAIVGLAGFSILKSCPRWPLALITSVYVFFAFQSELEPRHVIYWVPAYALLAVHVVKWLNDRNNPKVAIGLTVLLILCGGGSCYWQEYRYVRGYDAAVKWMLEHQTTDRPLMFDGEMSASFVFHLRKNDRSRQVWALRGDKLLYSMFSDPSVQYQQKANNEAEVLELIHEADPEMILIEDPPSTFHVVPGSVLLWQTLKAHPEMYAQEHTVTIDSNYQRFTNPGTRLLIYRKLHRNPNAKTMSIDVFGLGGSFQPPK